MVNAVAGANKKDTHLKNVNLTADYKVDEWIDARLITEDDPCPKCDAKINVKDAIEIGHTFKLGTKYSEALSARYLDENGKEKTVIMGCYGIGVNRILASLIETSHDDKGIIWPVSIAPYEVVVIPVNKNDEEVSGVAEKIYSELKENGHSVIIDDRDKSPGVKFKDAELIGFPVQVVIGKRNLDNGQIEIKERKSAESILVSPDELITNVNSLLQKP